MRTRARKTLPYLALALAISLTRSPCYRQRWKTLAAVRGETGDTETRRRIIRRWSASAYQGQGAEVIDERRNRVSRYAIVNARIV